MMQELEIKESDLSIGKKEIAVEEDSSMGPIIVSEDDRVKKSELEVTWKDPQSFLTYLKKALGATPSYSEGSTNALKRAIAYCDILLAEIEETAERDANYVDFNNDQIKELDIIDNAIVVARNKLVEKLGKIAEGNVARQNLIKTASTPRNLGLVYTVDPFLKAIAVICINAKVQGGKNIEEIYQALAKEYKMDKREELAVRQILKDMGYPIRHSMLGDSSDMIEQYYA